MKTGNAKAENRMEEMYGGVSGGGVGGGNSDGITMMNYNRIESIKEEEEVGEGKTDFLVELMLIFVPY